MRLAATGLIALTLTVGCVRLGYGPAPLETDAGADSGMRRVDGSVRDPDSAVDGGGRDDGAMDAAMRGDADMDAGILSMDGGGGDGMVVDPPDSGPQADASMDSGPMDSGTVDAGNDEYNDPARTAACPDNIPGAVFCDGFEDPSFAIWSHSIQQNGTLEQSTSRVRTGSGSLRARTNYATTSETAARLGIRAVDHMTSGNLWARFYYYVPSAVVVSSEFSTGVLSEVEPPYYGFSLTVTSDGVAIASEAYRNRSTTTFPRDQWVCVEMHALIADSGGSWGGFINGAPFARTSDRDTRPDRGYTTFDVGIHYAPAGQGAVEVFVDDVVVATSRPGC